jgi:uncharacterized protein YndB with AHSA1/START domain
MQDGNQEQAVSANKATASANIDAPAEAVYTIISDYRDHHPHILPDDYFFGLEVLEGGIGAGTRMLVRGKIFGREQRLQMGVSEPEPGRVLSETDLDKGQITTTFVVEPRGTEQTTISITTKWTISGGLQGLFERLFFPRYMKGMLEAEVEKLARYAAEVKKAL